MIFIKLVLVIIVSSNYELAMHNYYVIQGDITLLDATLYSHFQTRLFNVQGSIQWGRGGGGEGGG